MRSAAERGGPTGWLDRLGEKELGDRSVVGLRKVLDGHETVEQGDRFAPPAVVGILWEHSYSIRTCAVHAGHEPVDVRRVPLGVEVENLPAEVGRRSVGEPQQRLGLAGTGPAHDHEVPAEHGLRIEDLPVADPVGEITASSLAQEDCRLRSTRCDPPSVPPHQEPSKGMTWIRCC